MSKKLSSQELQKKLEEQYNASVKDYVPERYLIEKNGSATLLRTRNVGVFMGNMVKRVGGEALVENCRRLWYWEGAATLNEIAQDGLRPNREKARFPREVKRQYLLNVEEELPVTDIGVDSINSIPCWSSFDWVTGETKEGGAK